jgi:hypothetical protein
MIKALDDRKVPSAATPTNKEARHIVQLKRLDRRLVYFSVSTEGWCPLYAALCLEDAVDRLRYWLYSECSHRSRAIAEPVLLLCAIRLHATKWHYWRTVDEFTATLDTPLQRLSAEYVDPEEKSRLDSVLSHRIRRFVEIYVVASVRGRTVGSRTKPTDYPILEFEYYKDLSDIGEMFGRPLQTITTLANAGSAKPSTDNVGECKLLFALFEPDKK